jgi:hypothetical protein
VSTDALERQVEPVLDLGVETTRAVDRHLAAGSFCRKHHHAADRVTDAVKRFALCLGDLPKDRR